MISYSSISLKPNCASAYTSSDFLKANSYFSWQLLFPIREAAYTGFVDSLPFSCVIMARPVSRAFRSVSRFAFTSVSYYFSSSIECSTERSKASRRSPFDTIGTRPSITSVVLSTGAFLFLRDLLPLDNFDNLY